MRVPTRKGVDIPAVGVGVVVRALDEVRVSVVAGAVVAALREC